LIQVLILLSIGAVGGFLSGLLGIGGGVILIPLLVYVGHTSIAVAASANIVVIIFASISGGAVHYGKGNVHALTGTWMGLASMVGALVGSLSSNVFSEEFFYYLYMALVAAAIIILLFPRPEERATSTEYQLRRLPTVFIGLFKGFVTGVLGIGGSFIVIPLTIYFLDMPIHMAVGTSLLVTLFSAVAGFFGKLAIGHFDLSVIIWVVLGVIPTTQVGVWAAQKSSPRLLRLFLGILLVGILIWMIWSVLL